MNPKKLLLAVFVFVIVSLTNISGFSENELQATTQIASVYDPDLRSSSDYDYERVLEDGIWYIYVYDGVVLVDVYPEE